MLEAAFPALPTASFELAPAAVEREVRGPEASSLKDRLEFGGPSVVPIDESYGGGKDEDLKAFVRGLEARWHFFLVHMSVNFPPGLDPPLCRASVQVALSDDQGGDTIAYSIFPTRLGTPYDVSKGYTLSPNLTIGPVGGGLGSLSGGTTDHGTRDYVLGGPELASHPTWIFQQTPVHELAGSTRLVMVVQKPVGRNASLEVDLGADVEEGRLWRFFKRRIALPGAEDVEPETVHF